MDNIDIRIMYIYTYTHFKEKVIIHPSETDNSERET